MGDVRVKPLTWEKHPVGYIASTANITFIIDDRNFRPAFIKWPSGSFAPDVKSVVEAKAKAQDHFESLVLSALQPAPMSVAEAARVIWEEVMQKPDDLAGKRRKRMLSAAMEVRIPSAVASARWAMIGAALRALASPEGE